MDYRDEIIHKLAEKECTTISAKVIRRLQRMTESMQSGDDTPLKNIWDEICVQVQSQESIFWELYLTEIARIIASYVDELDNHIKQAIWLQTDEGVSWECDHENADVVYSSDDDIVEYIMDKFVLPAAADWSNERIKKYLDNE